MRDKAKIIVSKFGGTSMGDASCMLRSAEVSWQQKSSVVVVSATSGTTNQLIQMGHLAQKKLDSEYLPLFHAMSERHFKIADDLKVDVRTRDSLAELLQELNSLLTGISLLQECSPRAMDHLQSFGERMSSLLFARAMQTVLDQHSNHSSNHSSGVRQVKWLDARDVIETDDQFGKGRPLVERIRARALKYLIPELEAAGEGQDSRPVFVTQGFIGQTAEGITTTLGRGGSDYSAALFAEAVKADILEIWTDVPGIATTDPRLCAKAVSLKEISFKEASELATFGAKVLHPATLLPAMRQNIPTFVGSSFDANQRGTWVLRDVDKYPLIRAMALRRKQALVTLTTPEMLNAHGFLFQVFKVFNDHKVSIDAITTSEISVSMSVDEPVIQNQVLLRDLEKIAEVQVEKSLCLVSLIGNNINHTAGLSKNLFETIPDINVRMICLGASKHNFCFLVEDDRGADVIERLHHKFIESVL